MTEERLISFDTDELIRSAAGSGQVEGLAIPSAAFSASHSPFAAVTRTEGEGGTPVRFFFTVSVPEDPDDGLADQLWSNAVLNAATLVLERELAEEAEEEGLVLSEMKGPGIGGIPIGLTTGIVEITGAERIGVSVNGEGTMCPPFTRCGFFTALGPGDEADEVSCGGCRGCAGSGQGCALCIRRQKMI